MCVYEDSQYRFSTVEKEEILSLVLMTSIKLKKDNLWFSLGYIFLYLIRRDFILVKCSLALFLFRCFDCKKR